MTIPITYEQLAAMSDLDLLRSARKILDDTPQLRRGGFARRDGETNEMCYCLVGSLRAAVGHYTAQSRPAALDGWNRVISIVHEALFPAIPIDALGDLGREVALAHEEAQEPSGPTKENTVYLYNDRMLYDESAGDKGKSNALAFLDSVITQLEAANV